MSLSLEKRARAYFEINCAHCHNPDGFARSFNLNLMYQTSFDNSGILFNKWNIEHRMTIRDMPKLGTTIIDKERLYLVQHYLASLKKSRSLLNNKSMKMSSLDFIKNLISTNKMVYREAVVEDIAQIQIVRHLVKENVLSDPALGS